MNEFPTNDPENVYLDYGSWISGGCLPVCGRCGQPKPGDGNDWCTRCENENVAEILAALRGTDVAAGDLEPGDTVLLDDGTEATVTDVKFGDFWFNTGTHGPGVAIGWRAGSSSGVMFRDGSDVVRRVTNG